MSSKGILKLASPAVVQSVVRSAFAQGYGVALKSSFFTALQAKTGAGDEARTRDVLLGKEVLYH